MKTLKQQVVNNLSIATDTIEHRMRSIRPPLADNLSGCFAVVQRPVDITSNERDPEGKEAIVELLTVSNDNQLLHVKRDLSNDSGWRADKIKVPKIRNDGQTIKGDIQQISAFYQGQRIYAMVHYSGPNDGHIVVPMVYSEDNGWNELQLENDAANALHATRQTDVYRTPNGNHFFYGVSTAYEHPQFFVVFETLDDGVWDAVNERVENPGATYRLLPGSSAGSEERPGHSLLEMHADGIRVRDFRLEDDGINFYIEWGNQLSTTSINKSQLNSANTHTFPSTIGTRSLLIHTKDKQLHYVAGYNEDDLRHTSLTGSLEQPAAIESVCIGRDGFNRATVFATSAIDRRLWVLRQTGLDKNNDLIFSNWVALGDAAGTIGCPRSMLDGAELFLVTPNSRKLMHLRQNQKTTIWHKNEIHVGVEDSIQAQAVTIHAVDIKTLGAYDVPVSNASLELRSDVSCDVSVNGVVRQLTSETWVKANSDLAGKLSLSIIADSLTAPNIHIKVSATDQVFTANPDNKVASRLRGKDPRIKFDVMSMRNAGLIPASMTGTAANDVIDLIREVGKASERSEGAKPSQTGKAKKFTFKGDQTIRQSAPELNSIGNSNAFSQTMLQTAPSLINENTLNSVSQLAGDFINWLDNSWEDVKDFTVVVANDVIQMIVSVGDHVHKLVVDNAEGIVRAFESIIQGVAEFFRKAGEKISNVVNKIVSFIQALFGWEDILICNDMLQLAVNDTLESAETFFSVEAVNWVQQGVDNLKHGVDEIFDKLEENLGPLDPSATHAKQSKDNNVGSIQTSMDNNRVATDSVQNQVQRNPDEIANASSKALSGDNLFQEFIKQVASSYEKNINGHVSDILADFEPTSLDELFSQGISVAIKAMRPLIYFAIDTGGALLQLGLRVISNMIKALKDILNAPLDLPIISDFYAEFSNGRKLKIMDVGTLLIAAPMTIIYKLVFGGKELEPPFTQADLHEFQSAPVNWGDMLSALSVVASGGKTALAQNNKSVGSALTTTSAGLAEAENIFDDAIKYIKSAASLMRKVLTPFAIATGFFQYAYGVMTSFKHGADTHDLTGTIGSVASVMGYIGKFIRFCLEIPSKIISMDELIDKGEAFFNTNNDKAEDEGPMVLPMILSIGTMIFTFVGLGLTLAKASVPVTRVVDVIAGVILTVLAAYTIGALIDRANKNDEVLMATTEGMSQLATLFSAIPGLFAWLVLAAAAANIAVPGSGEVMLIVIVAAEMICAIVSGSAIIMSVALPGLFANNQTA